MDLNHYPLNLDELKRGDYLSRETIDASMPETARMSSEEYKWFLMSLRDKIQIAFQDKGDLAYVKFEGDGLRILTHSEQSQYLAKEQENTRRKAKRQFLFQANVDASQLKNDDEKKEHERQLIINGRYIQAMQNVEKSGLPIRPSQNKLIC